MKSNTFFESYIKLEQAWQDFLQNNMTCSSNTALGMTSLRICNYIVNNPHCALKEIALSLNISLGSASQMVQAMTAGSLLKCVSNKDDKRRIAIIPQPVLCDFFDTLEL